MIDLVDGNLKEVREMSFERSGDARRVRLAAISFALVAAAGAVLLLAPLGTRVVAQGTPGAEVTHVEHPSLWQVQGRGAAVPLAIPAVLAAATVAAIPRFGRRAAVAGATLLGLWVLVGVLSVGPFYLPGAVAMALAAAGHRSRLPVVPA